MGKSRREQGLQDGGAKTRIASIISRFLKMGEQSELEAAMISLFGQEYTDWKRDEPERANLAKFRKDRCPHCGGPPEYSGFYMVVSRRCKKCLRDY